MEEWRAVPGYEGLYEISSMGRVKSLARVAKSGMYGRQPMKERIMKQNIQKGHCRISLMKDGKRNYVFVHRIMAVAFLGCSMEYDGKMLVCHKNDIGTDNRLENLYIGTHKTNYIDRGRNGNGLDNRNEKHGMCRLTNEQVLEIRKLVKDGITQSKISKMYGIDQSHVSRIKNVLNRIIVNELSN